jgi:predicted lipid-binding transport protein (Tim44 family)
MMQNLDVSTIVFAVVAIFVVYRLYTVLGTRSGPQRRPIEPPPKPASASPVDNVVPIGATRPSPASPADRWRGYAAPGSPLASGLDAIALREPGFDAGHFLSGARAAYEMVISAFAAGDVATLRRLLSPEVLANFVGAIDTRSNAGHTMTTTLVSVDGAEIVDARVAGETASIAVKFAAKLVSATRDSSGAVVEGSADAVADHLDIWTFSRRIGARDPNWLLAATETVH